VVAVISILLIWLLMVALTATWRGRIAVGACALLAALGVAGCRARPANVVHASAAGALVVKLLGGTVGRVPPGYLGLSMEIRGVEDYTGFDPAALNPVLEQLVHEIDPDRHPVLRLAGDSADWTWYPIPGMRRPAGVRYSLTPNWFKVIKAFAEAVKARLIVGVNMEVNSARVAGAEANAIIAGIRAPHLEALALGDEPDLYHVVAWYELHRVLYYGRPADWDFARYQSDYAPLGRALPDFPLAGPDVGQPPWLSDIGPFLSAEPRVRIATIHRYALGCIRSKRATIPSLLSDNSTRDFAIGLRPAIAAAHQHRIAFRLDEMNTVSCGGQAGVSDTFAAALWSLDVLFELARDGVDGVNVHTSQSTANQLFTFERVSGQWQGRVAPQFYGLVAFARAAPPGSRLLATTAPTSGPIHVWATRAPNAVERVVLLNLSLRSERNVIVQAGSGGADATLERLTAPSASATRQIALAGQSFGAQTSTGELAGTLRAPRVVRSYSGYVVSIPPASAAILTLRHHPDRPGTCYRRAP
jgi:hypothetical protein